MTTMSRMTPNDVISIEFREELVNNRNIYLEKKICFPKTITK